MRFDENPYYVLEVRPGATPTEIERSGQRLLAMLAVGLASASSHPTPFGPQPRDADRVRQALDALRDPERRWLHEVWAELPPSEVRPALLPSEPWPEALEALGWRAPPRNGTDEG